MTSSKRWYQLSLLQVLVATAVVALFVWLNMIPTYRQSISESFFDDEPKRLMNSSETTYGWPLTYSYYLTLSPEADDGTVELIGLEDETQTLALGLNCLTGFVTLLILLACVHYSTKQGKGPEA